MEFAGDKNTLLGLYHVSYVKQSGTVSDMVVACNCSDNKILQGSEKAENRTCTDSAVLEWHGKACKWHHFGAMGNVKVVEARFPELQRKPVVDMSVYSDQ